MLKIFLSAILFYLVKFHRKLLYSSSSVLDGKGSDLLYLDLKFTPLVDFRKMQIFIKICVPKILYPPLYPIQITSF